MIDKQRIEKVFEKELSSFETSGTGIKEFTLEVLSTLPDYFLEPSNNGSTNIIVLLTRSSLAYANELFHLEFFREKFQMSERDCIRSALFLCDGLFYGQGEEKKQVFLHPELMSNYIRDNVWEKYLPFFVRKDIADIVQTHSGQWNVFGDKTLRKPITEMEKFAHMCVFMSGRGDCTVKLPITESRYGDCIKKIKAKQSSAFDYQAALRIVSSMVNQKTWDGHVYQDREYFVIIDGQRVPVAPDLYQAFITAGQARIAFLNGKVTKI